MKVTILKIEFPSDFPLSEDIRAKIEKEVQSSDIGTDPTSPDSDWWVENILDWRIRKELRRQGYFKANVHPRPYLVLAKSDELQYIVAVEAEPGPQYRLRLLQFLLGFRGVSATNAVELQKIFPLHPGDIFDVSKIREGLEAIAKLYGQLGYIDESTEPETKVDDQKRQIDLVLHVDQQVQYRIAKFEVLGLDSQTAESLGFLVEPDQIFNRTSFEALFKQHQSALPANSSVDRNAVITRNTKDATVRIVLDFRPCPQNVH